MHTPGTTSSGSTLPQASEAPDAVVQGPIRPDDNLERILQGFFRLPKASAASSATYASSSSHLKRAFSTMKSKISRQKPPITALPLSRCGELAVEIPKPELQSCPTESPALKMQRTAAVAFSSLRRTFTLCFPGEAANSWSRPPHTPPRERPGEEGLAGQATSSAAAAAATRSTGSPQAAVKPHSSLRPVVALGKLKKKLKPGRGIFKQRSSEAAPRRPPAAAAAVQVPSFEELMDKMTDAVKTATGHKKKKKVPKVVKKMWKRTVKWVEG